MARIAGINIPVHKHTVIALTSIFGIGRSTAAGLQRDAQRARIQRGIINQNGCAIGSSAPRGCAIPGYDNAGERINRLNRQEIQHFKRGVPDIAVDRNGIFRRWLIEIGPDGIGFLRTGRVFIVQRAGRRFAVQGAFRPDAAKTTPAAARGQQK